MSETMVKQGTTPVLTFSISGYDLTGYTLYLAITTRGKKIIKDSQSMLVSYDDGVSLVAVAFTQEETLALTPGTATAEIKPVDAEEKVPAAFTCEFEISSTTIPFEVEFQGGAG